MLINAGGGFSQDVDVVAGVLHVEQKEDGDSREGKHRQPDEGQDVCDYNELLKQEGYRLVAFRRSGVNLNNVFSFKLVIHHN